MALSDYTPERREIGFKGGSFAVRGLTLDDLARLIRTHYADLERLVRMFDEQQQDVFTTAGMDRFVLQLCQDAPQLVASAILLASDEAGEKAEQAVRSLPFPVLAEALASVGELTFVEAGGVKNFAATMGRLLGGMLPARPAERLESSREKAAA